MRKIYDFLGGWNIGLSADLFEISHWEVLGLGYGYTCDDPVTVHGDTADLHLMLDGAEGGAEDDVPEDGRPVPAPGHGVPSLHRHTADLQLVLGQSVQDLDQGLRYLSIVSTFSHEVFLTFLFSDGLFERNISQYSQLEIPII